MWKHEAFLIDFRTTHRRLRLAPSVGGGNGVNSPIRLGLTSTVVGISGGVAKGEKRASELSASILRVDSQLIYPQKIF
jgi:hypothetical protein